MVSSPTNKCSLFMPKGSRCCRRFIQVISVCLSCMVVWVMPEVVMGRLCLLVSMVKITTTTANTPSRSTTARRSLMEKPRVFDPRGRSCADPRKRFYFDPLKALAGGGHFYFALLASLSCLDFTYTLACELYLMCSMHDAVKHSICHSRITDSVIPA